MPARNSAVAILVSLLSCNVLNAWAQSTAQNATAFSLLYGYPLVSYLGVIKPALQSIGVNVLENNKYLETAANTGKANHVVDPNEDTVYSSMVFDLSKQNIKMTKPNVPKDFFALWSYYDPFGNNFANIGSINVDDPGDYLLSYDPSVTTFGVRKGKCKGYVACIDSPTPFGIMDIRWLVYNYSSYTDIHRWQKETKISTVSKPSSQKLKTSLVDIVESIPKKSSSAATDLLEVIAKFTPWCPAVVVSDRGTVNTNLRGAGIQGGKYTPQSGVNLTQANLTALELAADSFYHPGRVINATHGWGILAPNVTGYFGEAYGIRTSVALTGYLMLASPNAVYPIFNNGSEAGGLNTATSFTLGPKEALLYTFSGRPPLKTTGFWSLTAYDNNYLIPNSLNRSALGDRSNITYPNGKKVYHSKDGPNGSGPDEEFQILVQAADVHPPANWTDNWIPSPAGGTSKLSLLLRWYDGDVGELVFGSYVYPKVVKQAAITA